MGEFEQMFAMFKKEMKISAERQDQKLREIAERRAEEMRDIFERHLEEIQNSMLRFKEYYIIKKNEETSSTIPTNNIINDTITIATTTGTTSTILPTDELNLNADTSNTTTTTNNNNINDNDNNNIYDNNTESFIYVEEECYLNSDNDFLTLEDYAFAYSIVGTTYTGIVKKNCASQIPSSLNFVTTVDVYHTPRTNTIMVTSSNIASDDTYIILINYYNFNISFPIYKDFQYRIFMWDPGKLYIVE